MADFILFGIHSTKKLEFLFYTLSICSSTSFVDILPLNMAEAVRYLPCLGSDAHIMFLASNIYYVSSGTVKFLYYYEPLEVRGANPIIKKWSLGNGTRLVANFLKSAFNYPGNLKQQVTPDMAADTK